MPSFLANVNIGAQLGLQSVTFKPKRGFGAFTAQVTIEESHRDELSVTDHPVENNASISDHAFRRPAELTIRCAWSNSPSLSGYSGAVQAAIQGTVAGAAAVANQALGTGNTETQVRTVYKKLVEALAARELLNIYTGKRDYTSMLLTSLSTSTNADTENSLVITASFKQIIIAKTQVINAAPPADQKAPWSTNPVADLGVKALQETSRLPSYFNFLGG